MKVVIIGAGLGGLCFGACAARDGHEVILIVKNKEPGGVLRVESGGMRGETFLAGRTRLVKEEIV